MYHEKIIDNFSYYFDRYYFFSKKIKDRNNTAKSFGTVPVAVYKHKIQKNQIRKTEKFIGTFESESTVTISSQLTQKIKKIYKSEKDYVKVNEIIAELDDAELNEKSNFINTKINSIDFEIDSVNANLKSLEQNLTFSKTELERNKKLFDKNVISRSVYDNSFNLFEKANSELETNKIKISKLNSEKESLKSNLQEVIILKGYTKIKSPSNGIIAEKFAEQGDLAIQGKPLFVLENAENYKVVFSFPQEYLGIIREKNPVILSCGNNHTIASEIFKIYPSVNLSRMLTAEIIIDSAKIDNDKIVFGKYVYIDVIIAENNSAVVISELAVKISENDKKFVFKIIDGKLKMTQIQTGIFNGELYEVLNGLEENDFIVTGSFLELNKNYDNQIIVVVGE